VKVKGQIWRARAADAVHADDDVVVTGVDGIRLLIARG
jgi:membrane protein implicated in regulation of membrane protease activity